MKILIKGGKVIDPANKTSEKKDILVESGKITKTGKNLFEKADIEIEAIDKIVCPGFIDLHVHLREPGREDKETILTGTKAAIKGGFTAIASMPNTEPACDNESIVNFIKEKARKSGYAKVYPIGAITKDRQGKELTEIGELRKSGCVAISDDGDSVDDNFLMRQACEYARTFNMPVFVHCEEKDIKADGVMNEGYMSTKLGLRGISNKAESIMVHRDLEMAEIAGAQIHVCHVSAKESVEAIKAAKRKGIKVTAEVTPHHLSLTDENCQEYDTNTKMNPPLRTKEDVEILKKALKEGIIDIIATDHAPHLESEKDVEFDNAPFGIIGLETAFGVCKQELVDTGILTIEELIEKMTVNPAQIIGVDVPSFSQGARADIVIIDPEKQWTYEKKDIISKSTNSPYIGKTFAGQVETVIVDGKILLKEGKLS